jgi:ribonuclease BN (tRNA processing enzyme)
VDAVASDDFQLVYTSACVTVRSHVLTHSTKPEPSTAGHESFEKSEYIHQPAQKKARLEYAEQVHEERMKQQQVMYSFRDRWNISMKNDRDDFQVDKKQSICYICQMPNIPGKFDPQKALALGLVKGPQFAKLARGESVENSQGQVIRPDQVISPSTPGPVRIIDISYHLGFRHYQLSRSRVSRSTRERQTMEFIQYCYVHDSYYSTTDLRFTTIPRFCETIRRL